MLSISDTTRKIFSSTVAIALGAGFGMGCDQQTSLADEQRSNAAFRVWTAYTSEEHQPLVCVNRYAVRGVDCAGHYCDNIALDCDLVGDVSVGDDTWSPYFSEEGAGGRNHWQCGSSSEWMTGITCRGDYCDDISIRCTQLPTTGAGACTWSSWYSEEQEPFSAPDGHYIKGIECAGRYCDDKRFWSCALRS